MRSIARGTDDMVTCFHYGTRGIQADELVQDRRHLASGAGEITTHSVALRSVHVGVGRGYRYVVSGVAAVVKLAARLVMVVSFFGTVEKTSGTI